MLERNLKRTTDTLHFSPTNVLLFKSRCNVFIGFRIIKELPGLVGSGTPCITPLFDTQAPTCFGMHVPSSGSFSCPRELLESRNGYVVCHVL
jgi:hypothetical protein